MIITAEYLSSRGEGYLIQVAMDVDEPDIT